MLGISSHVIIRKAVIRAQVKINRNEKMTQSSSVTTFCIPVYISLTV